MELLWDNGYTFGVAAAVLAAVLTLVGVCYLRAFRTLGRGRWLLLFGLRAAAILLVAILLFRPMLRFYEVILDKPLMLLVLDRSASMSVDDDQSGQTRFERAQREIERRYPTLTNDFRVETFVFAERTDPLTPEQLRRVAATGEMTRITQAIRDTTSRFSKESRPTVLLFSDGIENSGARGITRQNAAEQGGTLTDEVRGADGTAVVGGIAGDDGTTDSATSNAIPTSGPVISLASGSVANPASSAESARQLATGGHFTLYTIGVGSNLRDNPNFRDVSVSTLEVASQAALANQLPVTATVHAVGLTGRVVHAKLLDGETELEDREITLNDTTTGEKVAFEYVPKVPGRHTLTVRVEPVEGEAMTLNNARSAATVVAATKIRVLYIEGALRSEYGVIVDRFLAKDPDLEYCSLIRTKSGQFTRRSNGAELETLPETADDLAKFDVFILGDFDSTYWKEGTLSKLVDRLREGAGLIMIGGAHTLGGGGYAESPLAEVAPVEFGPRSIGDVKTPFVPQLTPDGRIHPIFTNISDFFPSQTGPAIRSGLPPLNGCTRVFAAKPGATVLATLPDLLPDSLQATTDQSPIPTDAEAAANADSAGENATGETASSGENSETTKNEAGGNAALGENGKSGDEAAMGEKGDSGETGNSGDQSGNAENTGTTERMPVLAVQPVGSGRFAVFCGDTTRHWQQAPAVLGQESPFIQFWGQMVRWAAGRDGDAVGGRTSLTAQVEKPQYAQGEPVAITATLRAATGEGIAKATLRAAVYRLSQDGMASSETLEKTTQTPEKKHSVETFVGAEVSGANRVTDHVATNPTSRPPLAIVALSEIAGTAGRYAVHWRPPTTGWYEIIVSTTVATAGKNATAEVKASVDADSQKTQTARDEEVLTAEPMVIEVGEPHRELEEIQMNDAFLSELALAAGGQYRHISTVDSLFDQLDRTRQQQRKQYDFPLANPPIMWSVLIVLLGVEWWLRRFFRLR